MRYVLEGEWSGYHSGQQRMVHREVVTKKRAEALRKLHTIRYTDGTVLYINVRQAKPRENVESKLGYVSLIRDAERSGESYYEIKRNLPCPEQPQLNSR
jgi:hypothetical protein